MKFLMGYITVQSVFITVRLSKEARMDTRTLSLFGSTAVVAPVIILVFTTFMAMVHQYSEKLFWNLKGSPMGRNSVGKRLLKAYKVEAVKSANFYPIRRMTTVAFLGMIFNLTGSILISAE